METDFALAMNATKYLEFDRDAVVSKLLSEVPARITGQHTFDRTIESAVEFGIAISDAHEPQLRDLIKMRNLIGAAAVVRLVHLKGMSVKDELLQTLVEARQDYNYCVNGVARALRPLATPDDIQKIVGLADSISDEVASNSDDNVAHGFTHGAADCISGLDITLVRDAFMPKDRSERLSEVRARVLCNLLRDCHSTDALRLAGELLVRGVDKAATAIYFIAHFAKPDEALSWATFSSEHVDRLVSNLSDQENTEWNAHALKCLCEARPDLREIVKAHAGKAPAAAKITLLYCASSGGTEEIFEALSEFAEMSVEESGRQGEEQRPSDRPLAEYRSDGAL